MKRSRLGRRDIEVFSLSFLDAICCGFGAVILLLVLTEVGEPIVFEKSREELQGRLLDLQQQLEEIRGTSTVLNRELTSRREQLSEEQQKIARLRGDLSALRGQYESSRKDSEVAERDRGPAGLGAAGAHRGDEAAARRAVPAPQRQRDRRRAGGQRVHHLHHRHLGQHGELRVAADAAHDAGSPQCTSHREGLAGDERRGRLHVPVLPRPLAAGHARAAQDRARPAAQLVPVQQLEPGRGHRRGHPHLLLDRPAGSASTCSATSSRVRRSTRWCARWT